MRKLLAAVLVLALVSGCGKARLDCSSEASLKASMEAMGKELSEDDQKKLAGSIMLYGMGGAFKASFAQVGNKMQGKPTEEPKMSDVLKELDGLTAQEIIAKGQERVKKMQAAQAK